MKVTAYIESSLPEPIAKIHDGAKLCTTIRSEQQPQHPHIQPLLLHHVMFLVGEDTFQMIYKMLIRCSVRLDVSSERFRTSGLESFDGILILCFISHVLGCLVIWSRYYALRVHWIGFLRKECFFWLVTRLH